MTREFLKSLGLEDNKIDSIMSEHGKSVSIDKSTITKLEGDVQLLNNEIKNVNGLLKVSNDEIESYKGMDIETIKKNAEEFKKKFEDAEANYKLLNAKNELEYKVKLALKDSKTKDESIVMSQLDMNIIKLDKDGNVKGLNEQIESLKEKKDYLFDKDEVKTEPEQKSMKIDMGATHNDNKPALDINQFMTEAIVKSAK